jgi:hypothetical protein
LDIVAVPRGYLGRTGLLAAVAVLTPAEIVHADAMCATISTRDQQLIRYAATHQCPPVWLSPAFVRRTYCARCLAIRNATSRLEPPNDGNRKQRETR